MFYEVNLQVKLLLYKMPWLILWNHYIRSGSWCSFIRVIKGKPVWVELSYLILLYAVANISLKQAHQKLYTL